MANRSTTPAQVKLFTPNVVKGDPDGGRYRLYRRGASMFSITPDGVPFRLSYEPDDCGLGCKCAAALINVSAKAKRLLERAAIIDNYNNVEREVKP